jgi:hypothetical protein
MARAIVARVWNIIPYPGYRIYIFYIYIYIKKHQLQPVVANYLGAAATRAKSNHLNPRQAHPWVNSWQTETKVSMDGVKTRYQAAMTYEEREEAIIDHYNTTEQCTELTNSRTRHYSMSFPTLLVGLCRGEMALPLCNIVCWRHTAVCSNIGKKVQ